MKEQMYESGVRTTIIATEYCIGISRCCLIWRTIHFEVYQQNLFLNSVCQAKQPSCFALARYTSIV